MVQASSTQRSVLITGCSSGIGECVAHGLRERGFRVFATARRGVDVERLTGAGFEALQLDLDDSASIERAVADVLERSGQRLYALFNNGAYGQPGAVEDLSREALRRQLETNVLGWLELTNRVIPVMRRQGEGRIVQNSSVLGLVALPYRGAYVASKFAIEGLTDTLRLELRGSGVFVSLVEPGPITSRFRHNAQRAFERHIEVDNSVHREAYLAMQLRLNRKGQGMAFTLPPEAVLKCVVHALEARRPRLRYPVTLPTWFFSYARRLLPARFIDLLLARIG